MGRVYVTSNCERCAAAFSHRKRNPPTRFCSLRCASSPEGCVTTADRFWAKVDKDGPVPEHRSDLGPCWVWTAAVFQGNGYGQFRFNGKSVTTHRVSWQLHHGDVPSGLWVLHHCDNRLCVRPDHLWLGTAFDNNLDMDTKGRRRVAVGDQSGARKHPERVPRGDRHGFKKHPELVVRGERHRSAKLNDSAVREIRQRHDGGELARDLGKEFGVSTRSIHSVTSRQTWKHVAAGLLILLMAVPAFAQTTHPFIKPDQSAAVVKESLTTASAVKAPAIAYGANHRFDRSFWIASSLFAAASTADIVTTHKALERGAVELNPIFGERNGLRTSANALATAGIWGIAAYCERRGQRRFGRILLLTGAAIRTAAAFWNHNRRR